jgi:hypothetical protein
MLTFDQAEQRLGWHVKANLSRGINLLRSGASFRIVVGSGINTFTVVMFYDDGNYRLSLMHNAYQPPALSLIKKAFDYSPAKTVIRNKKIHIINTGFKGDIEMAGGMSVWVNVYGKVIYSPHADDGAYTPSSSKMLPAYGKSEVLEEIVRGEDNEVLVNRKVNKAAWRLGTSRGCPIIMES